MAAYRARNEVLRGNRWHRYVLGLHIDGKAWIYPVIRISSPVCEISIKPYVKRTSVNSTSTDVSMQVSVSRGPWHSGHDMISLSLNADGTAQSVIWDAFEDPLSSLYR